MSGSLECKEDVKGEKELRSKKSVHIEAVMDSYTQETQLHAKMAN